MNQFTINFDFEGKTYTADVTEIGGLDDTQYAISPEDDELTERFKTNIVRKGKSAKDYQYSLPSAHGGDDFMKSLIKGLDEFLSKGR
ncbi:MAG TPA: hypothetical protein VMI12_08235 [Puia sp.]|nr:hypothetical protein [Puia sp.]